MTTEKTEAAPDMRSGGRQRSFPAWFAAVGLVGIVQLGMLSILMPLSRDDATQSGIVYGVFAIAGVTAPWLGRLADVHKAHRAAFVAGAALGATGLALVAVFDASHAIVIAGSAIAGVGAALASTVMFSFIVLQFAKQQRAAEMGRLEIVYYAGQMAGLALAGAGLSEDPPLGFGIAAALLALAAVLGFWLLPARRGTAARSHGDATPQRSGGTPVLGPSSNPHPDASSTQPLLREFGWFFAGWFLLYGGGSTFCAAFPALIVKGLDMPAWSASALYAVGIGASLFVFPFATRRAGETSPGSTLLAGAAVRAAILFAVAVGSLAGHIGTIVALGAGFIAMQAAWPLVSIGSTLLLTRHEPERSGAALGWLNAVSAVAGGLGAVLAGVMVPLGPGVPALSCALAMAAGGTLLAVHARKLRSRQPAAR